MRVPEVVGVQDAVAGVVPLAGRVGVEDRDRGRRLRVSLSRPDGASTGIGGVQSALDLADRLVKSNANSQRSHYIFQPAIGSFYEGAQWSHKELVSARPMVPGQCR
ncbi:hypothetical protein [Streptomyces sp. bgisy031]|uniref:hypothetical protein n=1 Tax=Streptomyces sp. bgisy031 TaxID=3413772 RepID=UPI003D7634B9